MFRSTSTCNTIQASIDDVMDEIITPGAAKLIAEKKAAAIRKRPSSANRKFDKDDESGDDRTGEPRDPQKAKQKTHI